ncbi:hypothetical protein K503DRAFT_437153 [Rhizopogon vinicolor AM-OR11-026]|uniref:Uncharacterized protein n=1 Tax=Rhizopogon vinicolor AM-OR11-026 TaxID=1314800 RepID=A0A1B7NAR9_9AGAM|nr:hypothetical protein K503DRAFT_437153 [Rhizopogon vinicolor AM-OR11-026]
MLSPPDALYLPFWHFQPVSTLHSLLARLVLAVTCLFCHVAFELNATHSCPPTSKTVSFLPYPYTSATARNTLSQTQFDPPFSISRHDSTGRPSDILSNVYSH